jgi:hypothetical protein
MLALRSRPAGVISNRPLLHRLKTGVVSDVGKGVQDASGDGRLSRRDLWEPGGAIPPGDPISPPTRTPTSVRSRATRSRQSGRVERARWRCSSGRPPATTPSLGWPPTWGFGSMRPGWRRPVVNALAATRLDRVVHPLPDIVPLSVRSCVNPLLTPCPCGGGHKV